MRTADFDFDLPEDRIALRPASPRDTARLLVARGDSLQDRIVADLPALLRAGDVLVFNDTRVIPAQLFGTRGDARIGVTLHKRLDAWRWQAFVRNARRLRPGDQVEFGHDLVGLVESKLDDGSIVWAFAADMPLEEALARAGTMPLPPYIAGKRAADAQDADDYQTMFAKQPGAVAAPTAGLHFTPALLAALDAAGVGRETLTLHVGAGTFLPVKADDLAEHRMHAEWGRIDAATAERLNAARARGGRVVAVGTTSLRLLESAATSGDGAAGAGVDGAAGAGVDGAAGAGVDGAAGAGGGIGAFMGDTSIFITPGYRFRAVDALLTNFHLPRSTLFMLVSALMGLDTMRAAYHHAIQTGYRFYSYGDACLLLPGERGE